MNFRHVRYLLALAVSCAMSSAQVQWQSLGSPPIWGGGLSACYDSARDRMVVYVGETWEYDGTNWIRQFPSQNPTLMSYYAMTYDPIRQRCVLLDFSETWTWDGNNWTLASTNGPPPRESPTMTWNSARGTVMMFGGLLSAGPGYQFFNDLWEWNGTTWLQLPTANAPPVSQPGVRYSTLSYDPDRQKLVVFGAWQPLNVPPWAAGLPVTWEWDAVSGWQGVAAGGPAVINRLQVFDAARRRTVLFGRDDQYSAFLTYERDGNGSWFPRSTASTPAGPLDGPAVYDSRRNRVFLMGWQPSANTGSMYAYAATLPATYEDHGGGCPGTLPPSSLTPTLPWSLPWLGETLNASLTNLPMSAAFMTMGFSDTTYASYPLPLNLGSFGMPGCFLRNSVDATVLVAGTGNSATFTLPVPNQASLRGLAFFQQAVALDPSANPSGAVMSNSIRAVVGTK